MLEQYWIPLAPFLLITAGLVACLGIFYSLKAEIYGVERRMKKRVEKVDAHFQATATEVEEMRTELQDAEERTAQLVPPAPARSGLNVNSRTQAIRMSRRGDDPLVIASRLGLPSNEVRLILKVHKIASIGTPAMAVSMSQAGVKELSALTS